jgi:nucleoid DNA-binding protein
MYTNDLIRKVANETRMTKRDISEALNAALSVIQSACGERCLYLMRGMGVSVEAGWITERRTRSECGD